LADQSTEKPSGDDHDRVKVKGTLSFKEFSIDLAGKPKNLGIVLLYVCLVILVAGAVIWAIGNGGTGTGLQENWRDQPLSEFLKKRGESP